MPSQSGVKIVRHEILHRGFVSVRTVSKYNMPDDSIQLLTALASYVRQNLLPYFSDLGATYSSGLSGYDGYPGLCTLHPKDFSRVQGSFFWWVHRFTSVEAVFDIGFGDREFIVETKIFYPAINTSFAPWELLLAHEVSDSQAMSGNAWVLSTDFMERTVSGIAEGTRKYWPRLSVPEPAIVDRAHKLRGRRMIYAEEEQRRSDRERAAIQASRAFHENRFDEAIRLLNPYKDDAELSRSSKILLHVAHKRKE